MAEGQSAAPEPGSRPAVVERGHGQGCGWGPRQGQRNEPRDTQLHGVRQEQPRGAGEDEPDRTEEEQPHAVRKKLLGTGQQQNHRITESQNSRGWKGPLWVI